MIEMYQLICEVFNKFPANYAILYVCDNKIISRSYADIKRESDQIIDHISEIKRGSLVAVHLGHKPCLIPVILCLLQCGIPFMLFNDKDPIENPHGVKFHAEITCQAHCKVKLGSKYTTITTNLGCELIICTNGKENTDPPCNRGISYVISTSGTLGKPRLVSVTENSIFSNIKSFIKLFDVTASDVIYFGTSLSFDPSLIELFLGLTTGATLLATSRKIRDNPTKLLEALFVKKPHGKVVSFMQMCPSRFQQFSTADISYILNESGLRILGLGGEAFPKFISLLKTTDLCKLYNFYGITEVSCWASVAEVHQQSDVDLGALLDDTEFQIEDLTGNMIKDWSSMNECRGILHIGSKTRICLIDGENHPEGKCIFRSTGDVVKVKNGRIYYQGRCDDIIKRFGQRVSLFKMQNLIYNATNLSNICVYNKGKVFAFFYIEKCTEHHILQQKSKIVDKIQVKLLNELEPLFLPDYYELLTQLPICNQNGKVNKLFLVEKADQILLLLNTSAPRDVFPKLWSKYLRISMDFSKNFWESGGTSLLAMQFASEFELLTKIAFDRSIFDLSYESALEFITESANVQAISYKQFQNQHNLIRIKWKQSMGACIDNAASFTTILNENYVAIGNFAHRFCIFKASNGELVDQLTLPNIIEAATLIVENNFYVPCYDGCLYCLRLEMFQQPKCQIIWTFKTGDAIKTKPCFDSKENSIIFASYDRYIYKIREDSTLIWRQFIGEPVIAEIKLIDAKLYAAGIKGSVLCLHLETGAILWKYSAKNPIFTAPEILDHFLIIVDVIGVIYCLRRSTHKEAWICNPETSKQMRTFAAMYIHENLIFLGTQNGFINVYQFNEMICNLIQSISLGKNCRVTTKPLYLSINCKECLLIATTIGKLYLFELKNFTLELIDSFLLPGEIFSSPCKLPSCDNLIYFGCRDNHFYCVTIDL